MARADYLDRPAAEQIGGEGRTFPVKPIFAIHAVVLVLLGLVSAFFLDRRQWISLEWGAFLAMLNFGLIALGWALVFRKKLVALGVIIIVIKYAILGTIIYESLRWPGIEAMWLCLGLASFIVTVLAYAQRQHGI